MKNNILKYTLLIIGVFFLIIIYLSIIGLETQKFNQKIKDKIFQTNNKLDLKLKKIKLTLDPFSLKINAKTIGPKIVYREKVIELEYVETKISLIALIKNQFSSSNLKISTKSILLKDFVAILRTLNNRAELFFLERMIKSGYLIADLELNFDDNGKIKKDYRINGLIRDSKIDLIKNNSFDKINFLFQIKNNIFNFQDINFTTNNIDFFSDALKVTANKKDFIFEGVIANKKSSLSNKLLKLIKLNFKNINFQDINFTSKNNFSFNIDNRFKLKNLALSLDIQIDEGKYKKPDLIKKDFVDVNDIIHLKDHKITAIYKNENLTLKGSGKIQLEKEFDQIDYLINKKGSDLSLVSNIVLSELSIKNRKLSKNFFPKINENINLKDHQININFKDKNLTLKGSGKIQLEKEFDQIDYLINKKGSDLSLVSNIVLSELSIKNRKLSKNFFPKINENINLKDHQININFKDKNLTLKGYGKIQLEKEFDQIDYLISKFGSKYNFDVKLDLNKTLLKVDYLKFKKDKKLNALLKVYGNYAKSDGLNLEEFSILAKNNRIILKNFILDKEGKVLKVDQVDLDYFDIENKKNKFILKRKQKNSYELNGSIFNANSLISDMLNSKDDEQSEIFKNDINLTLNLSEVYIDNESMVKSLNGKLLLENNKITQTNISALFENNENLTFTINTDNGEKITTLFSSRAKPLVKRYKFIKGYEEGYLDFYSSKKDNISKSTLKIYDFKLQEMPVLTKLLTLASLQGIADLLSGEGIRFNEFEMNFTNQENLMTIDEIYALGPAISILMDGYIERDKLISLKGTLVPATTLNKVIGSIPILGKILVGSKAGEGVFGVSFKIKGSPKDLETSVNPIKTLTPRFITRTLENIKKN